MIMRRRGRTQRLWFAGDSGVDPAAELPKKLQECVSNNSVSYSIEGNVKRNISPPSWKPGGKLPWHPAPLPRFVAAGGLGEVERNSVRREAAIVLPSRFILRVHTRPTGGRGRLVITSFSLSLLTGCVLANGSEPSSARREARRSEPWTARRVRRKSMNREREKQALVHS